MSLKFKKTLKISVKINARKCVGQNVKTEVKLTKNEAKICQKVVKNRHRK